MGGDLGNSMDLPYVPIGAAEPMLDQADALISGAVVVMASVADVPELGPKPALVFRFMNPFGHFYQPLLLVMDDDQMAKLRPLLMAAIHQARETAKARQS